MIGNLPQDDVTGQVIIYGDVGGEIITHVVKVALSSTLENTCQMKLHCIDEERERTIGMRD